MEAWDFAELLSKRPKCPFRPFFATSAPSNGLEVVPPPGHTQGSLSLRTGERGEEGGRLPIRRREQKWQKMGERDTLEFGRPGSVP